MNLQEQIGALETGVDQLIQAALAAQSVPPPAPEDASAAPAPVACPATGSQATTTEAAPELPPQEPAPEPPALHVARPAQNEITLTIGGQTVSLPPEQVGQLIEELANARASKTPAPQV